MSFLAAIPGPVDMHAFERRAAAVFSPEFLTGGESGFGAACDNILLIFQAISVLIIVAGLLVKMQQHEAQMESIAATLLKVGFIATIPWWRDLVLATADAAANAIGFQAVSSGTTPSTVMQRMWTLLGQWVPPGSPYLDVLQTQSAANLPPSGREQEWGLEAWNWGRGVVAATDSMYDSLWQSLSGGLRAAIVFLWSAAMACVVSISIVTAYVAEVVRLAAFHAGCAMLPVFIAGLAVDSLKAASVRFVFRLVSLAFCPIGWALAHVVTATLVDRVTKWMTDVSTAALGQPVGEQGVSVAVVAPYLGWGTLFLLGAVTLVVCLWMLGSILLVPAIFGRAVASGVHVTQALAGAPHGTIFTTAASTAVPPVRQVVSPVRIEASGTNPAVPRGFRAPPSVSHSGSTGTLSSGRNVTSARWVRSVAPRRG